jgi:hypothetical protein
MGPITFSLFASKSITLAGTIGGIHFFVKVNNFAIMLVISFWPLTKSSSMGVSSLVVFRIFA